MQKLIYEPAWGKTISNKDRILIEEKFQEVKLVEGTIQFTIIRWDVNHKGELLVISLVHNSTKEDFKLHNRRIRLIHNEEVIAESNFDFPNLIIPAGSSMPWTFIFPKGSYKENMEYKKGFLELVV